MSQSEPTLTDEEIDKLSPEEFERLAAEGQERFDTLVDDLQSLAWKQKSELLSAALDDDEWRKLQKEAEDYVAHLDGIDPDAQLILDLIKYLARSKKHSGEAESRPQKTDKGVTSALSIFRAKS